MNSQQKKRRYTRQSTQARLVSEAIRLLNDKPFVSVAYKRVEEVDEQVTHSVSIRWSELA